MTVYRFDPGEMVALAGDLRRAAEAADSASLALLTVPTHGLPPEAAGLVEGQTRALWRLLAQGAEGLTGGARYLTRMAGAVRRADDPTLRAAGLDLVRVTRGGEVVFNVVGDLAARRRQPAGTHARRLAALLGSLSGEKAVGQAVAWSEWRRALRSANVGDSSTARKISATLRERTRGAIETMERVQPGRARVPDLDEGKWKQWSRRVAGLAPGPAGDAADVVGYVSASRRLRHDEPQTGLSQAATDVRDFVNLVAASNHLAADVLIKTPITAPAAPINEGMGLAADAVVLTLDGANEARKGLGRAVDQIGDGFTSLVRPRW